MNKTVIEYCTHTWNPITGCYHPCRDTYCYARKIADRFKPKDAPDWLTLAQAQETEYPIVSADAGCPPFPCGFIPTLYTDRLDKPTRLKKPSTIFVCSMADLFGDWVPASWIQQVFDACAAASWHRYLFLTKAPKGIWRTGLPVIKRAWYGTTVTRQNELERINHLPLTKRFVSIEPILEPINLAELPDGLVDFVIVGVETGNRKDKVIPKREWIEDIVSACRDAGVPVFMKNNLRDIWGKALVQETPWNEKVRKGD